MMVLGDAPKTGFEIIDLALVTEHTAADYYPANAYFYNSSV